MPGDYSKEALVVEKLYTRVREESDGTGTRQTTARIRLLADAGVKDMAVSPPSSSPGKQTVRTIHVPQQ